MSDPEQPAEVRYAAAPAVVAAFLVASALAVALAMGQDAAGRLLLGLAAALLLGEGLRCALVRPTLTAGPSGVTVARGVRRQHLPWDNIAGVGDLGGGKPRRRAKALEIDLGHTVVLVPAYRLGCPLDEVVSQVAARRRPPGS